MQNKVHDRVWCAKNQGIMDTDLQTACAAPAHTLETPVQIGQGHNIQVDPPIARSSASWTPSSRASTGNFADALDGSQGSLFHVIRQLHFLLKPCTQHTSQSSQNSDTHVAHATIPMAHINKATFEGSSYLCQVFKVIKLCVCRLDREE